MGCWPGLITDRLTSLSAWTVIKDIYRAEPWIVLHRWPVEPMARWIQWVTSSWNIGTDWSPIVIICRWFRLSHNRPRWWVVPMYRSSSNLVSQLYCLKGMRVPSGKPVIWSARYTVGALKVYQFHGLQSAAGDRNADQFYCDYHLVGSGSSRSKAPPKRCLFSIPPPSQDCSFPLGLGRGGGASE